VTESTRPTTTEAGAPFASDENSLTIGADGLIILNDHFLIEHTANFNRERIPERKPHAEGGRAFGHFQVTPDVSHYTRAAVFQPCTKIETLIRFATVAGEYGSRDIGVARAASHSLSGGSMNTSAVQMAHTIVVAAM
jgi:catalase